MLEGVTLAQVVKFVVKVLINLAAGTVLDEKAAENTETAHPDNLAVKISIRIHSYPISGVQYHTLAYEHPQYPSSYRNHGVYQFVEQL